MFLTDKETVKFARTKLFGGHNATAPEIPLFIRRQPRPVEQPAQLTNQTDERVENVDNMNAENETTALKKDEVILRIEDLELENL